ncbi:hypothetical protein GGX14DRAFT_388629 [Mycena pura]|uniref:Uncharacterized protein n=1 Tax=Mycena pura TaxID=153505 RepID=A0AAD6VVS8_9AGAR|nr:hypothetical protein GGX14DRAFT_388629 [Mycena pura]
MRPGESGRGAGGTNKYTRIASCRSPLQCLPSGLSFTNVRERRKPMGSNPVFPVELEREIFETAALLNPNPTLLLVARRVLIWIEPLLYRVIETTKDETATALRLAMATKPASFFENNVRHILLFHTSAWKKEDFYALLRLCPRIESLAYIPFGDCSPIVLLPIFMNMSHLQRWSGSLRYVFGKREAIDLRASFFRTVTHLDIFDMLDDGSTDNMRICADLATLPALTNLCLSEYAEPTIVRRLLEECPVLRVLVNLWFEAWSRDQVQAVVRNPGTVDPRYVVILFPAYANWEDDWQRGVRGGVDLWVAAESFVAQKRRGEIEVIFPDRSPGVRDQCPYSMSMVLVLRALILKFWDVLALWLTFGSDYNLIQFPISLPPIFLT